MNLPPCPTLLIPIKLPVRVRKVNGVPKILAGGIPVTPINIALHRRMKDKGSTSKSISTYIRAARLYVEFCALRHQPLIDISDEEFAWFQHALTGDTFPDAEGKRVRLSGRRSPRTADLMLILLYSLAADIAERYCVSFDWRRYKGMPELPGVSPHNQKNSWKHGSRSFPRSHSVPWTPPKILGLPDDQFVQILRTAHEHWNEAIANGDNAFADEPENQRGALFYRNLALLLVLRFAGSRRSEVVTLRFEDIDRKNNLLYLSTKGHGSERLPVVMLPWVQNIIWLYVIRFRPFVRDASTEDQQAIFLSHSTRNYGQRISDESVRSMLNVLRSSLPSPWNKRLTPHTLRHSFGYDLQRLLGPDAITSNMRHASTRSREPYAAGPEVYAEHLIEKSNERLEQVFAQADFLKKLAQLFTQVSLKEDLHER